MESFEEMKQRYQKEMMRYAQRAKPQLETPTGPSEPKKQTDAESMEPAAIPLPAPPVVPQIPAVRMDDAEERSNGQAAADRNERDTAFGTLVVRVFTAREALPVADALVLISRRIDGNPTLQWSGRTDVSGNTPEIQLPTPEASLSEEPGHVHPYASYDIEVDQDGFYTAVFRNVPIFAGVTAVQPVEMVPLPQRESNVKEMIVVEREPSDL